MGKACKVPYTKRGFSVSNMPEGIDFKKPSCYGKNQRARIMEARDKIKFTITDTSEADSSPSSSNSPIEPEVLPLPQSTSCELVDIQLKSALIKTIGQEQYKNKFGSASMNARIEEEDIEVMSLALNQAERLALCAKGKSHFSDDAWLAIGANLKTSQREPKDKGVILAVYTVAPDDNFLLFYTEESLADVLAAKDTEEVYGNWLDLPKNSKSLTYSLLDEQNSILGKNIIKEPQFGPIYFTGHVEKGGQFRAPSLFVAAIIATLERLGFVN